METLTYLSTEGLAPVVEGFPDGVPTIFIDLDAWSVKREVKRPRQEIARINSLRLEQPDAVHQGNTREGGSPKEWRRKNAHLEAIPAIPLDYPNCRYIMTLSDENHKAFWCPICRSPAQECESLYESMEPVKVY